MARTEATKTETVPVKTTEPKYTINQLRKHSKKLFGVSHSTFDGAVSALSGEYTVEDMRSAIKNWGDKKIESPKKEDK